MAAQAAGAQHFARGALYMVATPIGNLADLTLRAVHALALADAVACEDTRVSGQLLRHLGLHKPLIAAHEHNERAAAETVLARLAAGERVAFVSDAGTPGLSDPGAVLAAAAHAAGHPVVPLPGASSGVTLLSAAGDVQAHGGHVFAGFMPARGAARTARLRELVAQPLAVLLFEAPHRMAELLAELAALVPTRRLTVGRELTKQFEQIVTLPAGEAPAWLAADAHRARGEFALLLHGQPAAAPDADASAHDALLTPLVRTLPLKQAVQLAAEISGSPRNALYARALQLKENLNP